MVYNVAAYIYGACMHWQMAVQWPVLRAYELLWISDANGSLLGMRELIDLCVPYIEDGVIKMRK